MNKNRFFYLLGAVALMATAACTTTDDDGDGGGGAGGTAGSGGTGGTGGGVACVSCADWLNSCDPECDDHEVICEGPGMTAFESMVVCMCGECESDCGGTCDTGGTDTANCDTCMSTAMVGAACSAELAECTNH